jgi:hypothetical protein
MAYRSGTNLRRSIGTKVMHRKPPVLSSTMPSKALKGERVTAIAQPENSASVGVLMKLGFRRAGRRKDEGFALVQPVGPYS